MRLEPPTALRALTRAAIAGCMGAVLLWGLGIGGTQVARAIGRAESVTARTTDQLLTRALPLDAGRPSALYSIRLHRLRAGETIRILSEAQVTNGVETSAPLAALRHPDVQVSIGLTLRMGANSTDRPVSAPLTQTISAQQHHEQVSRFGELTIPGLRGMLLGDGDVRLVASAVLPAGTRQCTTCQVTVDPYGYLGVERFTPSDLAAPTSPLDSVVASAASQRTPLLLSNARQTTYHVVYSAPVDLSPRDTLEVLGSAVVAFVGRPPEGPWRNTLTQAQLVLARTPDDTGANVGGRGLVVRRFSGFNLTGTVPPPAYNPAQWIGTLNKNVLLEVPSSVRGRWFVNLVAFGEAGGSGLLGVTRSQGGLWVLVHHPTFNAFLAPSPSLIEHVGGPARTRRGRPGRRQCISALIAAEPLPRIPASGGLLAALSQTQVLSPSRYGEFARTTLAVHADRTSTRTVFGPIVAGTLGTPSAPQVWPTAGITRVRAQNAALALTLAPRATDSCDDPDLTASGTAMWADVYTMSTAHR